MVRFEIIMTLVCSSVVGMTVGEQSIMANPQSPVVRLYQNPVIHADYSDPDVVSSPDGSTFYMTASSFQSAPGLPILKSHNLVDWTLVNYAIDVVPPTELYSDGAPHHGKGVWAPSIKYHDGEYYIYWGDPDVGIFMVKAENPEGQWSEPVLVKAGKGLIDPTPFWDEDGKAYLANGWAASRAGFNSVITISEMTPDGTSFVSAPVLVFDGNDGVNHTVEGPKMYKRGDYYYLFAPAGGVATGWQLVMRSKEIYGPYESKIVMAQGDTDINGPHQGAWVSLPSGQDWFLHFQDKGPYGRVVHLNPMKWVEDWPVIGIDTDGDGCGNPVETFPYPNVVSANDEEGQEEIFRHFQWHANPDDFFGFTLPDGSKRIYSHKLTGPEANLWEVGNLWLMKFPADEFTFTTNVNVSSKADATGVSSGIVVMGYDYCRIGLTVDGRRLFVQKVVCHDAENGGVEEVTTIAEIEPGKIYEAGLTPNMTTDISFIVKVDKGAVCRFFYSLDGESFKEIPGEFMALPGKWIGAKIGYYSIMPQDVADRGWIDIKSVEIDKNK